MNHIPSQIKNTNTQIKEVKTEIRELRQDNKRIEEKIDKLLFYLIEEGKPQKPTNKKRLNQ